MRDSKNYTQEDLGNLLNLSKNAISHYENNTNRPSYETLIRLAEIFDVSTDYLLGRTTHNISYMKISQKYINGISFDRIIDKLLSLDSEHRKNIVNALNYISFHNDVKTKNK